MKHVHFSEDFNKLQNHKFTTIRDHNKKLQLEETVRVISPSHDFLAEVVGMEKAKLEHIDYRVLLTDLGLETVKNMREAEQVILENMRKFYPDITWDTIVFVYIFRAKKSRGE